LILIVVGFLAVCGWLVADSGLFGDPGKSCILLQQTTVDKKSEGAGSQPLSFAAGVPTSAPASKNERLESADLPDFSATGGPAETVVLGALDPNTEDPEVGFKFQLKLSSKGAAIEQATFSNGNDNGFDDRDPKNPQPLVVLSPIGRDILSMATRQFVLVQENQQFDMHRLSWKSIGIERGYDGSQTAQFEATINDPAGKPAVKLTTTYKVYVGSYLLDFGITVENFADSGQKVRFNLGGPVGIGREAIRSDMRKVVGGFATAEGEIVSSRKEILTPFFKRKVGLKDATLEYQRAQNKKQAREHLRISPEQGGVHFLWAAVTNKYFAAILRPVPDEGKVYCDWVKDKTGWFYNPDGDKRGDTGDETVGLNLEIAPSTLAAANQAGSTKTYNFQLYLGPKDKSLFDKNEQYRNLGFVQTIDFMACCCPASIIRPLAFGILALMKWMYGIIGNYGVVIIIIVFLIRIAIHPLTKKSQVSMSRVQKILSDPQVQEIRKKYSKSPLEMQKRISAFQKERGVSPASSLTSMLPMMVQMPILIALWSAIYASVELRGAPFLPVWITDLSVPDALVRFSTVTVPFLGWKITSLNLLPILMGLAIYLQQKLMPSQAAANPQAAQQQKIMMIMMPLFLPLVLYNGPSGVNLYFMTSTFAGVIEQHIIRKHIREKEGTESRGLVAATSKTGGKVKKKKPKPFYRNM